jgi:hypothetical protein
MCREIPRAHEVSITAKMTVSEGQPTLSVDPEASLRAELLSTIAGAQFDIDNAIAELARNGGDASALTNQRQSLQQLQKQVGTASLTTLAGLRAEIAGAVATTQTLAEQGRVVATTAGQAAAEALATASANSRAQVTSIIRDMHRFDSHLDFASTEDEAAYRKRETERLAYINGQHAKGTPEGDLNAAGAAIGQMADAKAHGAGDSPEFEGRWNELVTSTQRLRDAARANGVSTDEFDRNLRDDLRGILKSKGLSDTEVASRFAANPDPLEAVKAYVKGDDDFQKVQRTTQRAQTMAAMISPDAQIDMRGLVATLQTAGVTVADVETKPALATSIANSLPRDHQRTV